MGSRWTMDSTTFCAVWAKNLKANVNTNDAGIEEIGHWRKFIHELWSVFYPLNADYAFIGKNDVPLSSADGKGNFDPENKDDAYYFLSEKSYQKCANIARSIRVANEKNGTDHKVPSLPHGYLRRSNDKSKTKRVTPAELASLFA